MNQIPLQQINCFLHVAKYQSFSKAAEQLGISKSAISLAIKNLEDTLNINLFIRTTRRVTLTAEGELFQAQCQRLQEEVNNTHQFMAGLHSEPQGLLRISTNTYLAEFMLIDILKTYLTKFPKMRVEIITEERMPDMLKENIDIVFGVNWPAPLDAVAKKIGETRYVMCGSPDYFKKHGKPSTLDELSNHQLIPHIGRHKAIVGLKKSVPQKTSSRLAINNTQLMKKAALQGLGITQLHHYVVADALKEKKLVEVLSNEMTDKIPLYMYYQKNRIVQPKVKGLVTLLSTKVI